MKKIIHINWSLAFGGIETMLVNIANAQVQEGAEVTVIIINDLYDESLLKSFSDKVNIVFLYRKQHSYSLTFLFKLNKVLERINPDAIHLHNSRFFEMIFSRKLRRKVSMTLHALPTGVIRNEGFFYRLFPILSVVGDGGNVMFIDKIPRVFAISNAVQKELWEKYCIPSTVVCNGIRTESFSVREATPYVSPMRIVQVSRLEHDKKGQDLLIQAVAQLNGKAEVYFIGDGQSLEHLKRLAAELRIEKLVYFLGKQTQEYIARHLCEYDLFVQPSRYEGFGLTVAEAMAAQVPVLVSAGQGPAEVTCGNKYGWLFENGNVDDLTDMIEYICNHYVEALDKAKMARQYVVSAYDVAITARKYLEGYEISARGSQL